MANVNVDADYEKYQSEPVTGLIAGTTQPLPAPTTEATAVPPAVPIHKPEKIMIQAHPNNSDFIVVGQDQGQGAILGPDGKYGGYFIGPGQQQILSGRDSSKWLLSGTSAVPQIAIVTYLSGVN